MGSFFSNKCVFALMGHTTLNGCGRIPIFTLSHCTKMPRQNAISERSHTTHINLFLTYNRQDIVLRLSKYKHALIRNFEEKMFITK